MMTMSDLQYHTRKSSIAFVVYEKTTIIWRVRPDKHSWEVLWFTNNLCTRTELFNQYEKAQKYFTQLSMSVINK